MLAHRQDKILAATGVKPADWRQQGPDADLVETHQQDQDQGQQGSGGPQDFA
jgi:hypothetical protein